MASGSDVKETVMTISFLKTCISNMIKDLERKHTTGANKRRATQIPEGPWKWFTSYELGFPLVNDKHVRPLHPLVETFVDDQLEAYLSDEEDADASQPLLIALMQTMKERWEDQTGGRREGPHQRKSLNLPYCKEPSQTSRHRTRRCGFYIYDQESTCGRGC